MDRSTEIKKSYLSSMKEKRDADFDLIRETFKKGNFSVNSLTGIDRMISESKRIYSYLNEHLIDNFDFFDTLCQEMIEKLYMLVRNSDYDVDSTKLAIFKRTYSEIDEDGNKRFYIIKVCLTPTGLQEEIIEMIFEKDKNKKMNLEELFDLINDSGVFYNFSSISFEDFFIKLKPEDFPSFCKIFFGAFLTLADFNKKLSDDNRLYS